MFGCRPTVLANEHEVLSALGKDQPFNECIEIVGTPQQALEKVADLVATVFENLP